MNTILDIMKSAKNKKNLDYSIGQELKIAIMRANPRKTDKENNKFTRGDGTNYKWNDKCERLLDQWDQRVAQGTQTYELFKNIKDKIIWSL